MNLNQILSPLVLLKGIYRGKLLGINFAMPNYIFKDTFTKYSTVVDVGCGNDADFSVYMINKYGLTAIGVDPTKRHQKDLKLIADQMGGRFKHEAIAVSSRNGKIYFNESVDNISGSILKGHTNVMQDKIRRYQVKTISLKNLPKYLNLKRIEFIKLDLEGAEYELISKINKSDLRHYQQIFIEFHDHCVPQYTVKDTLKCVNKMESLGFNSFTLDNHNYLFYPIQKNLEKKTNKIKVLFEQCVIPHYRVAFFRELAKRVDLLVVASTNNQVDGLKDMRKKLPFKVLRLPEDSNSTVFHKGLVEVINKFRPDIYLSSGFALEKELLDKDFCQHCRNLNIKFVWMGCDGYLVKNFWLDLLTSLIDYRKVRQTLKQIYLMSKIDGFVTYSTYSARYLEEARLVNKQKIVVAHNAIESSGMLKFFHSWTNQNKKKYQDRIVYAGRLTEGKRVDVLLEAMAKLVIKNPKLVLDIIGEGSMMTKLVNLAGKYRLTKNVTFVGPIYNDIELAEKLIGADLMIMPGLGGLGLNTGMSLGLPIIYTDADGTEKDIMRNNYNGWYFDGSVDDLVTKVENAIVNKNKLKLMGRRSVRLIEEHINVENMVESYVKIFEAVK